MCVYERECMYVSVCVCLCVSICVCVCVKRGVGGMRGGDLLYLNGHQQERLDQLVPHVLFLHPTTALIFLNIGRKLD